MHQWTLHVERADGTPVDDATITVDGDMPQHGHGMPTQPQVTENLGNGDYLVDGLKFQMGGWWLRWGVLPIRPRWRGSGCSFVQAHTPCRRCGRNFGMQLAGI